jgi:hypothetical protein
MRGRDGRNRHCGGQTGSRKHGLRRQPANRTRQEGGGHHSLLKSILV